MLDREGLLDLAEILQLKAEVKAKQGDKDATAFFEVAEGILALADDPDLPALALSVPYGVNYKALADLAVALVTGRITMQEYVEAAAVFIDRERAKERALGLCNMKATATA